MSVEDWVVVLQLALDPDSPFRDLVQLQGVLKLPVDMQWAIFRKLPPKIQAVVREAQKPEGEPS